MLKIQFKRNMIGPKFITALWHYFWNVLLCAVHQHFSLIYKEKTKKLKKKIFWKIFLKEGFLR